MKFTVYVWHTHWIVYWSLGLLLILLLYVFLQVSNFWIIFFASKKKTFSTRVVFKKKLFFRHLNPKVSLSYFLNKLIKRTLSSVNFFNTVNIESIRLLCPKWVNRQTLPFLKSLWSRYQLDSSTKLVVPIHLFIF